MKRSPFASLFGRKSDTRDKPDGQDKAADEAKAGRSDTAQEEAQDKVQESQADNQDGVSGDAPVENQDDASGGISGGISAEIPCDTEEEILDEAPVETPDDATRKNQDDTEAETSADDEDSASEEDQAESQDETSDVTQDLTEDETSDNAEGNPDDLSDSEDKPSDDTEVDAEDDTEDPDDAEGEVAEDAQPKAQGSDFESDVPELAEQAGAGPHVPEDDGSPEAPLEDGDSLEEPPIRHQVVLSGEAVKAIDAEADKKAKAGKHAAPETQPSFMRRTVTQLDEKSGGKLRAHKWAIVCLLGVLAVVAIGLPLGFAAGWGVGTGNFPLGTTGEPEVANPNLDLRNQNVEEHYQALGIDEREFDRVSGDDIEPITVDGVAVSPTGELDRLANINAGEGTSAKLEVPLVNQLDDSNGGWSMRAGCEVASLSMLLAYSGVNVTKEEMQDTMPTVPLTDEDGKNGNPNYAFVGNMAGDEHGAGYSVYHAPVAALAQRYLLNQPYYVVDLTGQSFTVLLKELADGNPCWVITTTTMQPDQLLETWDTPEGELVVNWALHSVVLTGYDDEHVYINDPYGYDTNVAYDRQGFEEAWKLMGSQAVTIVPAGSVRPHSGQEE